MSGFEYLVILKLGSKASAGWIKVRFGTDIDFKAKFDFKLKSTL